MTARYRLLQTALRRQSGFSPELETWISSLAAVERARPHDGGSAGPVIAELEGLLALEPWATGDAEARASSTLDLGADEYVWVPRSTLMRARNLLERLSSSVGDQTGPSSLPFGPHDAGSALTTAPPGVICTLAEILCLGPPHDELDHALADAERVVAELAQVGLEIVTVNRRTN